MNFRPILLEQFVDTVAVQRNALNSELYEVSFVLLALFAVAVLSLVVVFIFRKQLLRRKRRHHHRKSSETIADRSERDSTRPAEVKSHKKRHRRRRKYRHRNPTLAETRGLPPNRSEQSMAPPAS